jgi:YHS domain-containing protein
MNRFCSFFVLGCFVAGLSVGAGAMASAADDRLAIKGYDPVAYFTESRPMVGDPRFEFEWDGSIYRFASLRHLEQFKVDPERYEPQYGNLCTAALSRGKRVISDPKNWIIQDGRLHLFGKSIGPELMRKDPAEMKAKADGNWPKRAALPWEPGTPRPTVGTQ